MGLGTALAVLVAGGARGYRAGQELQRRLAEAQRRMKLEEDQLALQREETQAKVGLYGLQGEAAKAETEGTRFKTGEEQRQSKRLQSPLPSPLSLGGLPIRTYEDLSSSKDYMNYLSDMARVGAERFGVEQRVSNPEAFGGARKPYLDPDSQAILDIALKFMTPISDMEAIQPGGVDAAFARRQGMVREFIRRSGTPRLRALMLGDSTSTGGNRFRGR